MCAPWATGSSGPWLKIGSAPPGQRRGLSDSSPGTSCILPGCSCSRSGSTQQSSWKKITPQLWHLCPAGLLKTGISRDFTVLKGMKCCFRSSTLCVGFDLYFFHSFTIFTCFQNVTLYGYLLCRPYNPLQRQTKRTSLIPSILIYSLFFQLPLSSVSHLTTHPVRSQKNCEDLESTKA